MSIRYNDQTKIFRIDTPRMSYVFGLAEDVPVSLYWGAPVNDDGAFSGELALAPGIHGSAGGVNAHPGRYEFSTLELGDYGEPSLLPEFSDGVRGARLAYVSHTVEGDTLRVLLRDRHYPLEATLCYRTVGGLDLIDRWAEVKNAGSEPVRLLKLRSGNVQLPSRFDWRAVHYAGNWGAEYQPQKHMLSQEQVVLESHRGTCSAAQHTPFIALDPDAEAADTLGEVFFMALQWSGEIRIMAEKNYFGDVQVCAGWNDFDADYMLNPGETLNTPVLTVGYSAAGYNRMTEILYDWQFDHLCPQTKSHNVLPIIYNSWYPYEFDVYEENMLGLIDKARDIGAELFVIDDGWMPGRTDDKKGLGDWTADKTRFPRGLRPIADACHEKGLLFGLWVEPEMCNPDSDLYRAHPDWVIGNPTREQTLMRNQVVLNFARDDVRDWAIDWLDRLIDDFKLDYLKWDMNRYLSEAGWPDADAADRRSLTVRYMQNIYKVWAHLNEKHPNVLFENCASGGGRTDFGMARYADRINRSDNALPRDVLSLHEGFSRLFIAKTAGGAGNISNDESAPLDFRIHLGMTGSMSVGLNLLKTPPERLKRLREATDYFKTVREDLQNAYVYTLSSANERPYAIFEYLRRDRKSVSLFAFGHNVHRWSASAMPAIRLRGLIPDALYRDGEGRLHTGAELMNVGVRVSLFGDYCSKFIRFTEAEK